MRMWLNLQICAKLAQNQGRALMLALYHVNTIPKWSDDIVEYLKSGAVSDSMPKHCRKALEIDAQSYTFLGEQLYKRGKDGNLHLCVCEHEYIHSYLKPSS